jgi:oligopeptidase B
VVEQTPPVAPRRAHTWHRPTGDSVDEWAWCADRDDPETIAYITAENDYTSAWFAPQSELVESVFQELKSRVQETDESVPSRQGSWWYVSRTFEGKNYPVHCRGPERDAATEHVLLDQNVLAEGHEYLELGAFDVSPSGGLLAYSVDNDGSEEYEMRFRDLATGDDLADTISPTYYGTAWSGDNAYLFYIVPNEQMRPHQIWRHRIGTPQTEDVMVLEEVDERFHLSIELSRDEQWIVIEAESKTTTECWLIAAGSPTDTPRSVRGRTEGVEYSIEPWGDRFLVVTNEDAEDFRVMSAPLDAPGDWTELVPHFAGRRITQIEAFATHFVLHEWYLAQPRLRVIYRDGSEMVPLTGTEPCDVEFDSNPEWETTSLRFNYQSLTTPRSVYEDDFDGGRTLLKMTNVIGVDLTQYVSTRLWAPAPDGTSVPVDVVHRIDTPIDGTAPTCLYGYGSYESSMPPWFSPGRISLLDRGWVFAVAHVRGGGELGRNWYLDGKLLNKRNTFTDFIACGEHLIAEGYCAPGRLAIRGGSAGGLLVGASMSLRPDLFATVIAEVPFVDVVSSMSNPDLPLTATEWEEWGDPRAEPYASYMLSYSPYDNVAAVDYPAMYITSGLNDPRVVFHEPTKWTAKLRAHNTGTRPILLKTDMGAGHGGPSGRYDGWREEAHTLAFLIACT